MATAPKGSSDITFDFDFYRFNGKGARPSLVPSVEQASFIRSRNSIEGALIELAAQRMLQWAKDHGLYVNMKKPFPSGTQGKFWLEFRFGGLSL